MGLIRLLEISACRLPLRLVDPAENSPSLSLSLALSRSFSLSLSVCLTEAGVRYSLLVYDTFRRKRGDRGKGSGGSCVTKCDARKNRGENV